MRTMTEMIEMLKLFKGRKIRWTGWDSFKDAKTCFIPNGEYRINIERYELVMAGKYGNTNEEITYVIEPDDRYGKWELASPDEEFYKELETL